MTTSSGLCLDADIQLGNLVFNTIDADGTTWIVTDLDGWWTIPEPEILDYPLGADDGSYEAAGRYQARVFTITGTFIPKNSAQVAAARAKLIRAADLCRQATWFLTRQSDFVRGSRVVLSAAPQISTINPAGRTDFAITLKAPDPIKYAISGGVVPGWYQATGTGALAVTNSGDYSVKPTFTVTGASAGSTITNQTTSEVMTFREAAALELTIDNQTRSVVAGTLRNQRKFLEWDTDWISLAPGLNNLTISGATVTVKWRHGWIG